MTAPINEQFVQNASVENSNYTLIPNPRTDKNLHVINFYVYREPALRGHLQALWNGGKGIKNKETLEGASVDQKIHHRMNVLFRNMELQGPLRKEFANFKYDSRNDLYHCHLYDGKPTYVISWECDMQKRIINIVNWGTHENFKFERVHDKDQKIDKSIIERSNNAIFQDHQRYLLQQGVQLNKAVRPSKPTS
jgi:hypothetical protein